MTTFRNFPLKTETGWATRVIKPILKTGNISDIFIYLLYLTLVYEIVKNNSTNKYQQNQVKI